MNKKSFNKGKQKRDKILFISLIVIMIGVIELYNMKSESCLDSSKSDNLSDKKEMPEAMKRFTEDEDVEWMAGMWVKLKNCVEREENIAQNIDSYCYMEDAIQARVMIQNGLDLSQPYFFMLFSDGVPIEFKIKEKSYQSYSFDLLDTKVLELEFKPEFCKNLGRLDFLIFFDGNPKSDYHMMSYTIWMEQRNEILTQEQFLKTVVQRDGLKENFLNGAYGAWVWNEGKTPLSSDNAGTFEVIAHSGENMCLEAIASQSGKYCTVTVLDRQPLTVKNEGEEVVGIEWKSAGDDMLQLPIIFPTKNEGSYSFFTVITPLEMNSISTPCLASGKILVTYVENMKLEGKR